MSVREGCLGVVMLPLCLYMAYTTSVEQTLNASGKSEKPQTRCCRQCKKCFLLQNLHTVLFKETQLVKNVVNFSKG